MGSLRDPTPTRALSDGLYTVPLIVVELAATRGPGIHQGEFYASVVLQGFLLHDINPMRRPADTSGGPRWPISKKEQKRFVFPAGDTPSGEVVICVT